MSKTKITKKDISHISSRKASRNSVKTTSMGNSDRYNVSDKYKNLLHTNGTLVKAVIGAYAINQSHHKCAYNNCSKKLQKVKKLQNEFERAQRYAASAHNTMDNFSNIAGESFQRVMLELKLQRIEKKAERHRKHIESGKKIGRIIGNGLNTIGMVSRTSMMQKAMSSPSGSSTGIDRDKLAVGMGMFGDDVPHVNPVDPEMEG